MPVTVRGSVARGYEAVEEALRDVLAQPGEQGAAFAVYREGELVVDLWGNGDGADPAAAWSENSVACVMSGTKGLVTAAMLTLVDRGLVELDRPVSHYWPQFARKGKRAITVRNILTHGAALPGLEQPVTVDQARDPREMAALLSDQQALAEPGKWTAYHALTFGWLCAEVIWRVTGQSVGSVLSAEVTGPLAAEAWLGLPEDQEPRVATLIAAPDFMVPPATDPMAARLRWSIWENPPRFSERGLAANSRAWLRAEVPGTNAVASARGMARIYAALAAGGRLGGHRVLSDAVLETARSPQLAGSDPFLRQRMAFGVGFQLQTEDLRFGPPRDAFGHPGAGGSIHGAWPTERVGFAFVPTLLRATEGADARTRRLLTALHGVAP